MTTVGLDALSGDDGGNEMHGSCDGTVTIFRRGQTGGASDVNDPAVVSNRIDGVDLKGDDRITERPFGERLVRVETDCQLVTSME